MKRRGSIFSAYILLVILLPAACAKIGSPSGGPRDKTPPVVVETIPENKARNFNGKKVVITFNEFVQLEKINEKLMISPPVKERPDVLIRGKSIIIEFFETLRDSTTYTLYFGDAIRDLNEGNIINDYQFVFSTGSVIDSLSVTGNVRNSFSLDPVDAALVLLYRNMSDSSVIKELPVYLTKTDKQGYFRINNIKEGKYRLYSLVDEDNSKNFNLPEEQFAFYNEPVIVSAEKNYIPVVQDTATVTPVPGSAADTIKKNGEYQLFLFTPEKKMRYLTSSSRDLRYQLRYTLSLPPDSMKFKVSIPDAPEGSWFTENSRLNDTLTVWITDSTLYSKQEINTLVTYPFTDSLKNVSGKTDTILMRFLVPRVSSRTKIKRTPYKLTSALDNGLLRPGQQISFVSPTPVKFPDTTKIKLYALNEDKQTVKPYSFKADASNSCILYMKADLKQGETYLFVADSAAFKNLWGERSDSAGVKFSIRKDDSFGSLKMNITNYEGNRVVQLLTKEEKTVREITMQKTGSADFKLLDKGIYRLRNIYDLNGDGKWTTGDFLTGRQPEPVSFFPMEIEIKENWNLNNDWDISKQQAKVLKPSAVKAAGR